MTTITPFLWYDDEARQAAERYVSLFADSRIDSVAETPDVRALMASAVHGRRIWKVSDPVVGVSFHPLSSAVQLLVGWCDESTALNETVRIPLFAREPLDD